MLDAVQLTKLSNNSFERKNVTFLGVKTYSDLSYVFSGDQDPQPPGSTPPDYCNVTNVRNASMLCVPQHLACVDLSNVL